MQFLHYLSVRKLQNVFINNNMDKNFEAKGTNESLPAKKEKQSKKENSKQQSMIILERGGHCYGLWPLMKFGQKTWRWALFVVAALKWGIFPPTNEQTPYWTNEVNQDRPFSQTSLIFIQPRLLLTQTTLMFRACFSSYEPKPRCSFGSEKSDKSYLYTPILRPAQDNVTYNCPYNNTKKKFNGKRRDSSGFLVRAFENASFVAMNDEI